VEARGLLGVLARPAVRAYGLGRLARRGCRGPSRVPQNRPPLGTPQDVLESRAPLPQPPTRATRRCATPYRLAPLRRQRRVASRNCGAKASCRGRPPTRLCRLGTRHRGTRARMSRILHPRPLLPHGSQARLQHAHPRRLVAVGGGPVSPTAHRGTPWPGCERVPGVWHTAWPRHDEQGSYSESPALMLRSLPPSSSTSGTVSRLPTRPQILELIPNWLRVFRSAGASRRGHRRRQQQHTRVVWPEKCGGLRATAWHKIQVIAGFFWLGHSHCTARA
jgi:hypothetical protein